MPRIYKVTLAPDCPRLALHETPLNKQLLPFDGGLKSSLSRGAPFPVHQESAVTDPRQFWTLAPGVLVYPEQMIGDDVAGTPYYCWAYHVELLSLVGEHDNFCAMNTEQRFPHPKNGFRFDLNFSYPLFRLEGEPPTNLYCLEGQAVSDDELRVNCEKFGLKGLVFEEVWAW